MAALSGAAIAFDLDGTLVDTAHDLVGALNWLLAEEGVASISLAEARPFIGRGARWLIERGFEAAATPLRPGEIQPLLNRFLAHYEAHIADKSRPFPGCLAALQALKDHGAKLVVCTNKLTGLSMSLLNALGMTPLFDAVVGADRAPAIKPDPRHLQAAIAEVGGSLSRAILVGDAATDAGAARAAGVPLILVSFGYTETPARELAPDILIDHFDELLGSCLKLLGA